jgi:ribosomal protein S18 acetylase RimI-like enzyme
MPLLLDEIRNVIDGNFVEGEMNINSFLDRYSIYILSKSGKIYYLSSLTDVETPEIIGYVILKDDIIYSFCIRLEYQSCGNGFKLLSTILKARRVLKLHVRESNENAIKLYNKLGFTEIARHYNFYSYTSKNENAIEMISGS